MKINFGGHEVDASQQNAGLTLRHEVLEDGRIRLILEETEQFFVCRDEFDTHCSENDLIPARWPFEQKDLMGLEISFAK